MEFKKILKLNISKTKIYYMQIILDVIKKSIKKTVFIILLLMLLTITYTLIGMILYQNKIKETVAR
jgi:hypothetical protein